MAAKAWLPFSRGWRDGPGDGLRFQPAAQNFTPATAMSGWVSKVEAEKLTTTTRPADAAAESSQQAGHGVDQLIVATDVPVSVNNRWTSPGIRTFRTPAGPARYRSPSTGTPRLRRLSSHCHSADSWSVYGARDRAGISSERTASAPKPRRSRSCRRRTPALSSSVIGSAELLASCHMEILMIRHALPVRIDAVPGGGPADPALAPRGVEQAESVAAALRHHSVDAIYTSPQLRAVQTAAPLARILGITARIEPGLREFDSEDLTYVPVEELRASGDPRWHRLVAGDLPSAGVDPIAFRATVVEAVERIAAHHPGGLAILVSHSGVINAYAGHVLGQQRPLFFGPAYCSITRLGIARNGRTGVISLNETGHVRDLL